MVKEKTIKMEIDPDALLALIGFVKSRRGEIEADMENFGMLKPILKNINYYESYFVTRKGK